LNTCLIYGYAQLKDGTLDAQTKARCDVAARLYGKDKIEMIFLTVEVSKAGVPMAEAMKDYLRSEGVFGDDIVIFRHGRNTAGETDAFLSITASGDRRSVYVVSTWYHIPRILYLWWVRGVIPRTGISWRKAHLADLLIEPLKMLNAILRPRKSAKVVLV